MALLPQSPPARLLPRACTSRRRPSAISARLATEPVAGSRSLAALAAAAVVALSSCAPALAALSNPNTRLPSNASIALRRSLPRVNADTAAVVGRLEDVLSLLRIPQRKPWGTVASDVESAHAAIRASGGSMLLSVPSSRRDAGLALLETLETRLDSVAVAVAAQDADATASRCTATLAVLAELEQLQAPGLTFSIPAAYAALPRLTGRATVELQVAQKSGPGGRLVLELDGYNAPLTAGNVAALVKRGFYDGVALTGSLADEALFAVPGRPSPLRASLPLEVRAQGDFEPRWRSPLDIFDGGGELPVLPLSVYGAVAASRGPQAAESDGAGLFLYRFHKQDAGLGGLSFSEGEFAVAGYVTSGGDLLRQLHDGDTIRSARIVKGEENLVLPTGPGAVPPAEEVTL